MNVMDSLGKIIEEHFGLRQISSKKLNGYESINHLIEVKNERYIFKQYQQPEFLESTLTAESRILLKLSEISQFDFPIPIKTASGELFSIQEGAKGKDLCRLLSFVDGEFLAEVPHTIEIAKSFGEFLAVMDTHLLKVQDDTIKARQIEWDLQYLLLNEDYIACIQAPERRKLVHFFFAQYKERILPVQHRLRKSIIHNDANDWNVLTKNGKVSGIIDFGDMVHAPLINELAVAMAYILMGKSDPIKYATNIIQGYVSLLPLLPEEIDLLYYLIPARLCMSVSNSAHGKEQNPENSYLSISEKGVWALLEKWLTINPIHATNEFRKAAGLKGIIEDTTEHDLSIRNKYISTALSLSYDEPIKMEGAAFQYMYDALGNTYLDTYNNIPHVGHSHPKVVRAGQSQMLKLNTNTRYIFDALNKYSTQLLAKFPTNLNKVFFVNSGSAASDLAIRLAMAHTGHRNVMAMEYGYHGNTRMSIDMSHYKFGGKGGQGQAPNILKAPLPDTYKGPFRENNGSAGKAYAAQAIDLIKGSEFPVAAFIAEPVVGCGGQVPLAKGYLQSIYPVIREQGGLCISDEVQTGFGRLGSHYWGFEMHEVSPDIVVLGKPIGNAHPMAAVVTTQEVAESFENGMEFFSSFGGNPVSCAIGSAVLEVIEEEGLQQNANKVGSHLMQGFLNLQSSFPCIGDVRGSGLFIGIELIRDQDEQQPNTELAGFIKNELKERRILISTDGPGDNVLKIKPPLCFNLANANHLLVVIEETLKKYYG